MHPVPVHGGTRRRPRHRRNARLQFSSTPGTHSFTAMSAFLAQLGARCHPFESLLLRRVSQTAFYLLRTTDDRLQTWQNCRQFHGSQVVLARKKEQKVVPPTKAQLAAKARKKALKAKKNVYAGEKMTLEDAINVLRVRRARSPRRSPLLTCTPGC